MEVIFTVLQLLLLFLAVGVGYLGLAGGLAMAICWLIEKLLEWIDDLL